MKKIISLTSFCLICCLLARLSYAQQNANLSFQGSFEECKQVAVDENKLILIDLYFEGCMPCKMMDDKVFPDPKVSTILDADYVVYKTDVFKEEDGKKLARKYAASGFPTYLLMDQTGRLIRVESGYFNADRFVDLLNETKQLNDQGKFLAFDTDLNKTYPAAYNERFFKTGTKQDISLVKTYIDEQTDPFGEEAFVAMVFYNQPEYRKMIFENLHVFIAKYGYTALSNSVTHEARSRIQTVGKTKNIEELDKILNYIRPTYNYKTWHAYLPSFMQLFYNESNDALTYLHLLEKYAVYSTWDEKSNSLGEIIINHKRDKEVLSKLKDLYHSTNSNDLSATDLYKLALIEGYLQQDDKAHEWINQLKKIDLSPAYFPVKTDDVLALQKAIENKNIFSFVPVNAKLNIPIRMD